VPGRDLYIAMMDRWVYDLDKWLDEQKKGIHRHITETNTSMADYVWLPIVWTESEGNPPRPMLEWKDEWRLEDYL
jgi:hypothetical protein